MMDKLRSHEAASRKMMPSVEHRQHRGLKNQAEAFQQPTREREHRTRCFKSMGHAQRFLSTFEPSSDTFVQDVT
ncbi:MAG: hypothetical protein AAF974_13230 [Cyanobacteria bacterium P01_E01_bin.34]